MDLDNDEIYINLEQTCPTVDLMETHYDGRRYVQAWSHKSPWGGEITGFLPGHAPEATTHPDLVRNVKVLIDDLLA